MITKEQPKDLAFYNHVEKEGHVTKVAYFLKDGQVV